MTFTDEQLSIFQFVKEEKGHGIINAVAGAGKTTTIMHCASFVEDRSKILFCAFNTSIASEISKRFHAMGFHEVVVKTIHALGRQILLDNNSTGKLIHLEENKYWHLLKTAAVQRKLQPHFNRILKLHRLDAAGLDERKEFAAKKLIDRVHLRLIDICQKFRATLTREELDDFERMVIHFSIFDNTEIARKHFSSEVKEYFSCLQVLLAEGNGLAARSMTIDYTDMLYLPYKWKLQPDRKYDFLFIDECQDLSAAQFAIATKYGRKDGRILAVGDPVQSIYGFTGADIDSFNRIRDFTRATQLSLTTCFRCPAGVVELAREIRTDMTGTKEDKGIVQTIQFDDVVSMARPGDLIISRLRAPIVLLVFSFIDKGIRVRIHEDEVKEIISEIRMIFKQEELNLAISAQPGGFAGLKKEVLRRWNWIIEKNAERISNSIERSLYVKTEKKYLERKMEFLHKKYELWKDDCASIIDMLKRIKAFISARGNAVRLSTIHRAKGLENDRVFILNYDELPYTRLQQKDWEKAQELNLKYVAITRALKELYLIESKKIEQVEEQESLFDNLPFGK